MAKRRIKGSGSVFVRKGRRTLSIKLPITGEPVETGLPDTPTNRKKVTEILDSVYLEHKFKNINPFEALRKQVVTIKESFNEFIETRREAKQERTIDWYKEGYKKLLQPRENEIATTTSITEILRKSLLKQEVKSVSQNTYLRAVRVYTNWLHKRRYIDNEVNIKDLMNEFVKVEPKPLPTEYTMEEKQKICEYFKNYDYDLYLMIRLMFECGLRWHESAELATKNITNKGIKVESKDHRKYDVIPISDDLYNELQAYKSGEYMFTYHTATKNQYRANLRKLKTCFNVCNIEANGRAFHEMRKTFISKLCRSSMNIDIAAKLARCAVDVIMEHYRVFNPSELEDAMKQIK
jgi:integrase